MLSALQLDLKSFIAVKCNIPMFLHCTWQRLCSIPWRLCVYILHQAFSAIYVQVLAAKQLFVIKTASSHSFDDHIDSIIMPQVSKEQFDKILDMCKQGEEQGAKLECGGKRLGDKGYYIEPTVFSNVQDDNIIATDEIFGPVQSILKWKTIDEVCKKPVAQLLSTTKVLHDTQAACGPQSYIVSVTNEAQCTKCINAHIVTVC